MDHDRDDGQHDPRRIGARVQHGLVGDLHASAGADVLAGVEVAGETREARARDVEPDAVPLPEDVGDGVAADPVLGDLAGLEQLGRLALDAAAVARPDDPLREEDRAAVGIDVAEADDEVRVLRRRRGVEHHLDRPDHLEIAVERLARVHEHVVASFEHALVDRPGPDRRLGALRHRQHRVDTTDRRHRVGRVVVVVVGRLVCARLGDREPAALPQVERRLPRALERPALLAAPLVRAEDVELGRRPLVPAVVDVLEEPVVEGELVVADHGQRRREVDVAGEVLDVLLVRPRADQHAVRDPAADRAERAQVGARVRIEPAALLEDRDVDLLGPVPEALPVLVVHLVLPPVPPVVDLPPDRHLVELDQRQVAEDPVVEDDVARARPGDQRHRARPEGRRAERERQLERSARPVAVPEVVVVDHLRREALHVRVLEMGELPLDEAAVAPAPGADAAVRPLLARGPGDRVVGVLAVVGPGGELAVGLVAAANVDHDGRVAALREPDAPGDEALARRLVRRPLHDRRQPLPSEGKVDVGRQRDAVAHRHAAVVQQADVVGRL